MRLAAMQAEQRLLRERITAMEQEIQDVFTRLAHLLESEE